jgi:predicted SnoaL-like aldol condensation-catalyzing enzyme
MPIAENIQTMQTFLGYFNPAQAERMAQGCGVQSGDGVERTTVDHAACLKDHVVDERLLHCLSALQEACPDLEVTIEDMIAEGNRVAVRFSAAGDQDGDGRTLAPGILIYRFAEGKIVEHWMQPDMAALLQMLGSTPTPALA